MVINDVVFGMLTACVLTLTQGMAVLSIFTGCELQP